MIRKRDIKSFIENYFEVKTIKLKTNSSEYVSYRTYFCFLCYQYSDESINKRVLSKYLDLKQRGSVYNMLNNLKSDLLFNKRIQIELGNLENAFVKHYKPIINLISTSDIETLTLKRKLRDMKSLNDDYKKKIQSLQKTIKNEEEKNKLIKRQFFITKSA